LSCFFWFWSRNKSQGSNTHRVYLCTDSLDTAVAWLMARGILRGGVVLIG
jgi:hypothetical protein